MHTFRKVLLLILLRPWKRTDQPREDTPKNSSSTDKEEMLTAFNLNSIKIKELYFYLGGILSGECRFFRLTDIVFSRASPLFINPKGFRKKSTGYC